MSPKSSPARRCLAHTASELREQLIAADARIVSMQADLNHATAEQHEQQLVHERQQQQLKECHAQQVSLVMQLVCVVCVLSSRFLCLSVFLSNQQSGAVDNCSASCGPRATCHM